MIPSDNYKCFFFFPILWRPKRNCPSVTQYVKTLDTGCLVNKPCRPNTKTSLMRRGRELSTDDTIDYDIQNNHEGIPRRDTPFRQRRGKTYHFIRSSQYTVMLNEKKRCIFNWQGFYHSSQLLNSHVKWEQATNNNHILEVNTHELRIELYSKPPIKQTKINKINHRNSSSGK